MFTGIITDVPKIIESKDNDGGLDLVIARPASWTKIDLGESISHKGVCLTVTDIKPDRYTAYLMPETLAVTTFGKEVPKRLNVERSMLASDRFGGHFVQGHADGIGTVVSVKAGEDYRIEIEYPAENRELVTHKGSISIDGVSLTIAECEDNRLTVALIPHTLDHTTLSDLKVGSLVNLEFDMIAKHIATIMALREK